MPEPKFGVGDRIEVPGRGFGQVVGWGEFSPGQWYYKVVLDEGGTIYVKI